MASPQPENFFKYSRELLLAKMRIRISGVQNQVFEAIMYKTYGAIPSVKMVHYSNKEICELTGLSKVPVTKAKTDLVEMKMLVTKKGNGMTELIGINKDYEQWIVLPKKVTKSSLLPKKVTNRELPKKVTKSSLLAKKVTNRELPKKVTKVTKKGNKQAHTPLDVEIEYLRSDSNEMRLSKFLFLHIKKNIPKHKEPNLESWACDFDKILRIDKRPLEELKDIIRWAHNDSFWFKNILSPKKLRKQYDTLFAHMNGPAGKAGACCNTAQQPKIRTEADIHELYD